MRYIGSKNIIAKDILPILLEYLGDKTYIEPFVGGANMIDKIVAKERIGADVNKYTIEALISIRDNVNELPKNNTEFTESDYMLLYKSDDYKHKGFAGFSYSYGGKWLGGWARAANGLVKRDIVAETYKNALKQSPNIQGIKLIHTSYLDLEIPPNSLIYCDPPYENTIRYKNKINHVVFWEWCRKMSENNLVFISEFNAPNDFECVWSKDTIKYLSNNGVATKSVEKLFKFKQ